MNTELYAILIEVYGLDINVILIARVIALSIFLFVAWKLAILQRRVDHIEALTKHNFNDLRIKLADAIGTAEESVERNHRRDS